LLGVQPPTEQPANIVPPPDDPPCALDCEHVHTASGQLHVTL
jgi:hypothetical protein